MKKKLSIIIPVYNVEQYLKKCLKSILCYKSNDYEIILVNDGSTDSSGIICDEYARKYENVISLHKKNGGASDARNYGIKKAKGIYIWFIDSDDYIKNGCVEKILNIIKKYSSDIIVCQSKVVENNGNVFDECQYSIESGLYSSCQFMKILKENPKSVIFCPQYYIVSKKFIEENNLFFYKGIIHEDELWIPQLLIYADKIYYSGLNIYYHFMHSTSVMHSTKKEKSGQSAFIVSIEMMKVFESCKRKDLEFLRDHNANIFLQAVWKIPNFLDKKENVMRTMPLKNSYYFKTKVKAFLYFLSPNLYLIVHSIRDDLKK